MCTVDGKPAPGLASASAISALGFITNQYFSSRHRHHPNTLWLCLFAESRVVREAGYIIDDVQGSRLDSQQDRILLLGKHYQLELAHWKRVSYDAEALSDVGLLSKPGTTLTSYLWHRIHTYICTTLNISVFEAARTRRGRNSLIHSYTAFRLTHIVSYISYV
ncbi:hypothetical protein KQX54_004546 [Cotesia glomerata]|uniref:Uncharacterized protein n=1 Tax=Cotesia glomerata TaxID=32391 RepID=A0AAV7HHN4_COTGL|nr:hypothetical protein KQX54_004546 [Cotesia glomerata]